MGRPKTIDIRPRDVLEAIASQIVSDLAAIDAELAENADETRPDWSHSSAWQQRCSLVKERDAALQPEQDTRAWAGAETASERIRGQQAIATLVDSGLLERIGRRVELTPAAWELLGLPAPKKVTAWDRTT